MKLSGMELIEEIRQIIDGIETNEITVDDAIYTIYVLTNPYDNAPPRKNDYKCGHCGYEGPCYGVPTGEGVTAPHCKQCGMNDKLTKVEGS